MATTNYSIMAIPVYWVMSLAPHTIAVGAMGKCYDNGNPRDPKNRERMLKSLTPAQIDRIDHLEGIHKNGFEGLPIFIAAIVLGNMTLQSAESMNRFAGLFLASRVAFMAAYLTLNGKQSSFARTGIWLAGQVLCLSMIVKSGWVYAAKNSLF